MRLVDFFRGEKIRFARKNSPSGKSALSRILRRIFSREANVSEYRHAQFNSNRRLVLAGSFLFEKVSSNSFYFFAAKKGASQQQFRNLSRGGLEVARDPKRGFIS